MASAEVTNRGGWSWEGLRLALRKRRATVFVLPALVLLAVVFAYPLFVILKRSFTEFTPPETSGLDNYIWFFETPVNITVLRRTFLVAGWVTAVCLFVGYPYAYLMTLVKPYWRVLMIAAVLVPLFTNFMVRNYAWIILLRDNGIVNTYLGKIGIGPFSLLGNEKGVTIGMAQILLPFLILPLYANLRRIDRQLVLAAQGLGATPRAAFFRVYFPLSLPGVFVGSVLVFVLALGFYITPALLGSPQNSLLSQLIIREVSSLLAWGRAGVMAVVLLVITLILLWLASRIASRADVYRVGEQP